MTWPNSNASAISSGMATTANCRPKRRHTRMQCQLQNQKQMRAQEWWMPRRVSTASSRAESPAVQAAAASSKPSSTRARSTVPAVKSSPANRGRSVRSGRQIQSQISR